VTGYPWYAIETPEHKAFLAAYQGKYKDYPRLGSVVGYSALISVGEALRKAKSMDPEAIVAAMKGLKHSTPFGPITYRALDHQSAIDASVGQIGLKDRKGIRVDWRYEPGERHLPPDDVVRKLRPE